MKQTFFLNRHYNSHGILEQPLVSCNNKDGESLATHTLCVAVATQQLSREQRERDRLRRPVSFLRAKRASARARWENTSREQSRNFSDKHPLTLTFRRKIHQRFSDWVKVGHLNSLGVF